MRRDTRLLGLLGFTVCAAVGCGRARAEGGSGSAEHASAAAESEQVVAPSASSAAAASFGGAAPSPSLPAGASLLLITVDALRADLSFNGYSRSTTPRLAALAERSVVYTRAYALSSYTSMSLAGLMAGRLPSELDRDGRATSSFGPDNLFLAEVLSEAGVTTLGAHAHVWFLGATGIKQGFSDWRTVPKLTVHPARDGFVSDRQLADLVIAQLGDHRRAAPGKRFFAWAHFMDAHFAYARHAGFRFRSRELGPGTTPLSPTLGTYGQSRRDAYDGEVAWVDSQIGRVLDWVEAQRFAEPVVIVITADHGEAFGEHGTYYEHGFYLYDVVTRVPLIVHVPGAVPRRIDARRSHLDLARTLLDLMRVPVPPSFRGTSLVPELYGAPAPVRDLVIDLPYTDQTPRRRALVHDGKKLIASESERRPLLYDLDADPAEQRDLALEDPATRERLGERLRAIDARYPDFPAPRRSERAY